MYFLTVHSWPKKKKSRTGTLRQRKRKETKENRTSSIKTSSLSLSLPHCCLSCQPIKYFSWQPNVKGWRPICVITDGDTPWSLNSACRIFPNWPIRKLDKELFWTWRDRGIAVVQTQRFIRFINCNGSYQGLTKR